MQYTTQNARGTQGYRAVELVRDQSFVTKASDIWALGCIFYQLAFNVKAFSSDFQVMEYFHTKRKPDIPPLDVDERTGAFIRALVSRTLEIDWWKRPAARNVMQLMDRMSKRTTSVFYIGGAASELEESSSSSSRPELHSLNITDSSHTPFLVGFAFCFYAR